MLSARLTLPLAAAAGLALAACGSNQTPTTVDVAHSGLGQILVDSKAHTLYLFQKDHGARSACFGACAKQWPPLRVAGQPTTAGGASRALVDTARRRDGKAGVTYNGHPLYLFAGDRKPGDLNGQGLNAFGGRWLALSPTGDPITLQPPAGAGTGGY